jgi:uncharacterized protein (DUF433 family)
MVSAKNPTTRSETNESRPGNGNATGNSLSDHPIEVDWQSRIGADPHRPGKARYRLIEASIPVWSIIGHLRALDPEFSADAIDDIADAFAISVEDVIAAIAYYREHSDCIDALLTIQADVIA